MLKALAWKEWREQRSVLFIAVVLSVVLPLFVLAGLAAVAPQRGLEEAAEMFSFVVIMFAWPLFATAVGAAVIAPDLSAGTLPFLLSRPVSRTRVWGIKVGLALTVLGLIFAGTTLFMIGYFRLTAAPEASWWAATSALLGIGSTDVVELAEVLAPIALLFACSVYCSALARRPLVAAAAGVGSALLIILSISAGWGLATGFHRLPLGTERTMTTHTAAIVFGAPAAAAGVLIASWHAFRRQRVAGLAPIMSAIKPLVAVVATIVFSGAGPVAYSALRLAADGSVAWALPRTVMDGEVVLTRLAASGFTSGIVVRRWEGSGERVLVPRHAVRPIVSPGGEWIVYGSYGSYAGILWREPTARAVRRDGSDDHALVDGSGEDVEFPQEFAFSADDSRVAYVELEENVVTVISLDRRSATTLTVSSDYTFARLLGWSGGDEILVRCYASRRGSLDPPRLDLIALDAETGASRIIRAFADGWRPMFPASYPAGAWRRAWSWLPVFDGADLGAETVGLVNTTSGELFPVADTPCSYWGFVPEQDLFYYAVCSRNVTSGITRIELHTRHIGSGFDEAFASLQGHYTWGWGPDELVISPNGDWSLLRVHEPRGEYHAPVRTVAISRGGEIRELPGSGEPLAWIDDRRALIGERVWVSRGRYDLHVAVVDIETRTVRTLHGSE